MKLKCFLPFVLLCFASVPSHALIYLTPTVGGPMVYGAAYIELSGTTSAFTLHYLSTVAPAFSIAQYSDPFANASTYTLSGANYNVSNMYAALPAVNYTVSPAGPFTWAAGPSILTILGSAGPITWTDPTDAGNMILIDLGLGQGTNFTYTSPDNRAYTGSGSFVMRGITWQVAGGVSFQNAKTGIGQLTFTPVPEPASIATMVAGLGLLCLRRRRR